MKKVITSVFVGLGLFAFLVDAVSILAQAGSGPYIIDENWDDNGNFSNWGLYPSGNYYWTSNLGGSLEKLEQASGGSYFMLGLAGYKDYTGDSTATTFYVKDFSFTIRRNSAVDPPPTSRIEFRFSDGTPTQYVNFATSTTTQTIEITNPKPGNKLATSDGLVINISTPSTNPGAIQFYLDNFEITANSEPIFGDYFEDSGAHLWNISNYADAGIFEVEAEHTDHYLGSPIGSHSCTGLHCEGVSYPTGAFGSAYGYIHVTWPTDTVGTVYGAVFEGLQTNGADNPGVGQYFFDGSKMFSPDYHFYQYDSDPDGDIGTFCVIDTAAYNDDDLLAAWLDAHCDIVHTDDVIQNGGIDFNLWATYQTSPYEWEWDISGGYLLASEVPTELPIFDPYCYIPITTTITVTDTEGITSTEVLTTVAQVESNLVKNSGFEDGGTRPDFWDPVIAGEETTVPPFYSKNASLAHGGSDSIYNASAFELWQDLGLAEGGAFLVGFYARCVSSECPDSSVAALWNGNSVVSASNITTTYTVYSTTQETGGGASRYAVAFDTWEGDVHVDDVFVYPVDETGALNCDPAYYDTGEFEDYENVVPGPGGIPIPWAGAGTVCYDCQQPYGDAYELVNFWLAWLGCVIRNMFSCSLRVWLLEILNAIMATLNYLNVLALWIARNAQSVVNWAGDMADYWVSLGLAFWTEFVTGMSNFSVVVNVYQSSFELLEAIINLLIAVAQLLLGVLDALVSFADLGGEFLQAVWAAWQTPGYDLSYILTGQIIGGDLGSAMSASGVNDSKIFVYVMWGIMTMDEIGYGLFLNYVQYPILGIFGFVVGKWVLDQLGELMPI